MSDESQKCLDLNFLSGSHKDEKGGRGRGRKDKMRVMAVEEPGPGVGWGKKDQVRIRELTLLQSNAADVDTK